MTCPQPSIAVSKRPPLSERAGRLDAIVDALDESLKNLIGKLDPVLGPHDGIPSDGAVANARGDDSWLAGYLDHITTKVDELNATVRNITSRVDL